MSEELLQRNLIKNPEKIGTWDFYNIGATSINALKESGIIRSIDYSDVARKKVDAIIIKHKEVIAIVEYKHPKQFNTKGKKNDAVLQEIEVAKKLKTKLVIATDTQETLWINVATGNSVKDEKGNDLKYLFDPKDPNLQKFITEIIQSIDEKNDKILPKKLRNPTDLAKQIWQDVWSVSGATPENCLYTFVELFIFKYLSDLNILTGDYNFYELLKKYDNNDVNYPLNHYANNIRHKIKELFPANQDGDKTTIINGTIFVSKDQKAVDGYGTVFRKVLEKFRDYGKLEHIDHDFKSQLFESFLKESISKKNWGQFFTPIKVVRAINEMAEGELKEGMTICDPACGVGKFPLEYIKENLDKLFKVENGKIIQKVKIVGFDKGFDKDEQKTIILAKANMLIYFCELIKENIGLTKEFAKIFNESFTLKTNSILGTLSEATENEYDLILTNPPYVTSGSSNLKEEIAKTSLKNHYKINAMGVEGLFMEWIIKALKPNGKAFIVVPDGIFNRQNDKNLRQYILDTCYIDAIISLPIKTFFTTPKKTYILVITKKNDISQIQIDPVFTYLCSEVGESRDIYRFDIEQDDLKEAVNLFNAFKNSKQYITEKNTDKRCKIQPIAQFKPEENWSIDRWFTREERVELGIEEENKPISINEFSDIINDIGQTCSEFSSTLKDIATNKNNDSYKEVLLSDSKFFETFIGKRITKKDLIKIENGTIPAYSANVFTPVGFVSQSNISNFSNNFVIWGIDGDFEFNYIKQDCQFCTTDHCGTIRILDNDILPEYLVIELERVKHVYGFDRGLRSSLKNMQSVSIRVPIKMNGKVDVALQQDLISKYEVIFEIKKKIIACKEQIENLIVTLEIDDFQYKTESLNNIVNYNRGVVISKDYVEKNKGEYPVYSSNTLNDGIFGYINHYNYDCDALTWTTDGIYAGTIFVRNGKFSITNVCGIMILKPLYANQIDLEFLKYSLDFKAIATGSDNKKVMTNAIINQNLQIKIPIIPTGEFDLQKQKEIAEKYRKIEEIKKNIKIELEKIENIKVDIGL